MDHGLSVESSLCISSCILPLRSHEKNLITLPSSNLAPLANNKTLGNQHPGSKLAVRCLFRVLRIPYIKTHQAFQRMGLDSSPILGLPFANGTASKQLSIHLKLCHLQKYFMLRLLCSSCFHFHEYIIYTCKHVQSFVHFSDHTYSD